MFENPENAAELYYALTDDKCSPDEIQIITITTIISGKLKNDLAFVVRDRAMVLGEHMSTSIKNMPTRLLIYVGQLYEKWIKMDKEGKREKRLYGSKVLEIPTPEFVIFYNGTANKPDKEIIKLSTAFKKPVDNRLGSLELEVPVYNINQGKNTELFNKCEKLKHYSEYIAKVREFQAVYKDYSQAVKEATNYCIDNGILADFLREHGGKLMSILTMEYDEEMIINIRVEEAIEEAVEEAVEEKMEEVAKKMLKRDTPVEIVAEDTGLAIETIQKLQAELEDCN